MDAIEQLAYEIIEDRARKLEQFLIDNDARPFVDTLAMYRCNGYDLYCIIPPEVDPEGINSNQAMLLFTHMIYIEDV